MTMTFLVKKKQQLLNEINGFVGFAVILPSSATATTNTQQMRWARTGEGEDSMRTKMENILFEREQLFFVNDDGNYREWKALLNWKVQLSQPWLVSLVASWGEWQICCAFFWKLFQQWWKVIAFNYSWESAVQLQSPESGWKNENKISNSSKLDDGITQRKKFYWIHSAHFFFDSLSAQVQ